MAGISLTNKEEQLSAAPLDNQGELEFASPMNPNSSTKNQQKSRKVDGEEHAIVCILISRIGWCKEKLNARERFCTMDLKP